MFFTSPDPLQPRDNNGKLDAYVWQRASGPGEPLAGDTRLLSTGASGHDSYFHGASGDGDSAFFRTREQLVRQDGDTLADLYVAQVEGGLASQQDAPQAACQGDSCQGPPTGAPPLADRSTESFRGKGNVVPPVERRRASVRLLRVTRRQRARLASGLPVMLRLSVSRAGRVRAVGRARIGNVSRVVARSSVRARGAGRVRLRLRLDRVARLHLERGRRLSLALRVSVVGARPDSATLRLRRNR